MNVRWSSRAWADYLHWQTQDAKLALKINALIEDVRRSPFKGLGKPEPKKQITHFLRQLKQISYICCRGTNSPIGVERAVNRKRVHANAMF